MVRNLEKQINPNGASATERLATYAMTSGIKYVGLMTGIYGLTQTDNRYELDLSLAIGGACYLIGNTLEKIAGHEHLKTTEDKK